MITSPGSANSIERAARFTTGPNASPSREHHLAACQSGSDWWDDRVVAKRLGQVERNRAGRSSIGRDEHDLVADQLHDASTASRDGIRGNVLKVSSGGTEVLYGELLTGCVKFQPDQRNPTTSR